MTDKAKVRMLRVSEKVWEALMRMKLDQKKESVDDLLMEMLKLKEAPVQKEVKEAKLEEPKKEEKPSSVAAS